MKFLIDTQLSPKLARYLKNKGYDCIHTTHYKDGHLLADAEIVRIAIKNERGII